MFYINFTLHIHHMWNLSPLLHGIYYQLYYEDFKAYGVSVVIKGAMLILMLGYAFVFAGALVGPNISTWVGINLRVFFNLNFKQPYRHTHWKLEKCLY
jgi:hypothetical protein